MFPQGDIQWADGTESLFFTPSEFLERLVALIPALKFHTTRHYEVLASRSPHRRYLPDKSVVHTKDDCIGYIAEIKSHMGSNKHFCAFGNSFDRTQRICVRVFFRLAHWLLLMRSTNSKTGAASSKDFTLFAIASTVSDRIGNLVY